MMKIVVVVTTMHQNDLSLYSKMNLQTDAIIANQCDSDLIEISHFNQKRVYMVSTSGRGLSRNRNIALAHLPQKVDVVVFSDDDLIFNENYEQAIIDEFEKHPFAEAIKFNIHDLSDRKISMKRITTFEKATRKNMSSSGVCALAIKYDALVRYNLHFNEFFGAGTNNYCGEDTIFIQEMINKKVKLYRSPIDVAGIFQKESSWFNGYDHRYFSVCGKVLATCYPHFCKILAVRSSFRFSRNKKCKLGFFEILADYFGGIKDIKRN
ncbi:MAG: hypothetical protein BWY97_01467 [Tenericutes bacterium ADurb.BinA124]|nr:MAG: hypothetical protein BWY97_01467 [Tenericutes bacterium ADurb.BinA124]